MGHSKDKLNVTMDDGIIFGEAGVSKWDACEKFLAVNLKHSRTLVD